ncbi:MAG: bifunctional DNA-formamidopyrimidine glycosylase/DNA-(apurinic or apyrimidinic site) lyase [Gemmataceae bacterium]
MPELPEVETVVRDLRPLLMGRILQSVRSGPQALRRPWQPAWNATVAGSTVRQLRRRGKWILIDLATGPILVIHLGMTGQLTVVPAGTATPDHLHLWFPLDNQHELRFRDIRRFGSAELFSEEATLQLALDERLGPEPFGVDPAYFRKALQGSQRNLKALLLDQTVLAGVGNIYADESCFHAQLHPERRGTSLKPAEVERLRVAIEEVLTRAIAGRGSTIRDYVGGSGLMGTYQGEFAVYGRTGEPCPGCGSEIEVVRLAGRSSHFCPQCQK